MRLRLTLAWFSLPVLLSATIALGHGSATGIIKERMDQMEVISKAMKALSEMMKENVAFDGTEGARLATQIGRYGGATLTGVFPQGSLDKPTQALPDIWSDWSRFDALAHEMTLRASRLAISLLTADYAPKDFKAQFLGLAKTCKSCHDAFRHEK